jgi:exopolysaccharide biosynthesis protein
VVTLVTIDGGRPTSVGATLPEAAAVARALGLVDSVNLDGGGSTTMAVGGTVVNQPKGRSERAVGDALVYVDRPWT